MIKIDVLKHQKTALRAFWKLQELRAQIISEAGSRRENNLSTNEANIDGRRKSATDLLDLVNNVNQKAHQELKKVNITEPQIDSFSAPPASPSDPEAMLLEASNTAKALFVQLSDSVTTLQKNQREGKNRRIFRTVAIFTFVSCILLSLTGGIYYYFRQKNIEANYQLLINFIDTGRCNEAYSLYLKLDNFPLNYKDFHSKLLLACGPEAIVVQIFKAYQRGDATVVNKLMSEQGKNNANTYCDGSAITCLNSNYANAGQLQTISTRLVNQSGTSAEVMLYTTWSNKGKVCQTYELDQNILWQVTYFDIPSSYCQ